MGTNTEKENEKTGEDKGVVSSSRLEADILINKLRHALNHIVLMDYKSKMDLLGKANAELDNYYDKGGNFVATEGF